MRQRALAAVAGAICCVGSLAVTGMASAQAAPATSGSSGAASPWGKAIEIPGLGALNKGGFAFPSSMSCVSAGNCVAAGQYNGSAGDQAFVVTESKGRWGKAIAVPGLSTLNKTGDLFEVSISCGSAGDCAVGGDYIGPRDGTFAFVASEHNGVWGKAIKVPGLGTLDTSKKEGEDLTSLFCSPGGSNCTAGGSYEVGSGSTLGIIAYVVSERNGRWGQAMPVSGLNPRQFSRILTLSCASAGNCSAGGTLGGSEGFVVTEKKGTWGKAIMVPGLSALNTGDQAQVDQMSCASAGNCVAGGNYLGSQDDEQAFVVSERNGAWGNAIDIPGLKALNVAGAAEVHAISCPAPGDCTVSGTYEHTPTFGFQGYVVSEKNGKWGNAIEIPNLGRLNRGGDVEIAKVACTSAGNCAAGGNYALTRSNDSVNHAFLAIEVKGVWGKAAPVPGLSALASRESDVNAIACPPSGPCVAGGSFEDSSGHIQGFVVNQK